MSGCSPSTSNDCQSGRNWCYCNLMKIDCYEDKYQVCGLLPTSKPTFKPSSKPTFKPSSFSPTKNPSLAPTMNPTFSPSSSAPTFSLPTVFVLGSQCLSPWGCTSFPSGSAHWIWNDPNAASSAASYVPIYFMKTFISDISTTGTLYMECDDTVITAYFNNEIVFSNSGNWINVYNTQVQVKTGSNSIVMLVQNYGGPAGLLASLYYSGSYIVNTDSTWTWTYNLPAPTPDPTTSPTMVPRSTCPEGYIFSENFSKCYKSYQQMLDWFGALDVCVQDGGQLVSIQSQTEDNFIKSLDTDQTAFRWIGLTDENHEGIWKWIRNTGNGGPSEIEAEYLNWYPGQPDSYVYVENCAHYYRGMWNDLPCGRPNPFICEVTISAPTPTDVSSSFRYLRWSANGNTADHGNHFAEIEIWDSNNNNLMRLPGTIVAYASLTPPYFASPVSNINNGNIYDIFATSDGMTSVRIDLGSVGSIKSIKFWHYWQDSRTYYNVQLMVSSDGSRWKRIYGPTNTVQTSSGTEILLSSISPLLPYFVIPSSYSYDIQPKDSYPDSNSELSDGIIAAFYYVGGGVGSVDKYRPWVGWHGNPTITFSFERNVLISKVSIHFQGDHEGGIYLPVSVTISGTTFPIGDLSRNGWFEFSGLWSGDIVTIKIQSSVEWTFMSEVIFTEAPAGTLSMAPTSVPSNQPSPLPSKTPSPPHHSKPISKPKNSNNDRESKHYEWFQGAKRYVGYQYQSRSPKRKDDKN